MNGQVPIENLDEILKVLNTKQDYINCEIFSGYKGIYIPKDDAISEVSILQIILSKLTFGCAVKMWMDWHSIDLTELKNKKSEAEKKLEKMSARYDYLLHSNTLNPLKRYRHKKEQKRLEKKIEGEQNVIKRLLFAIQKVTEIRNKYSSRYYVSFEYEKCTYKYITDNIISKNISPNFIPLLAFLSCKLGTIGPGFEKLHNLPEDRQSLYYTLSTIYPDIDVKLMVTGSSAVNGGEMQSLNDFFHGLNSYLETAEISDEYYVLTKSSFFNIFFQCIYSLAVMEYFGITHNDLHFNNILVHTIEEGMFQFDFEILNNKLSLITNSIVKIFDWNYAHVEDLGNNPFLNRFSKHRVNKKRSKQDVYQFFCGLSGYKNLWKFISPLLPQLPQNFTDYYFNSKKEEVGVSFKAKTMRPFHTILKYISSIPSEDLFYQGDGELFFEIPKKDFENLFQTEIDKENLKERVIPLIGEKHYEIAEKLYFKILFFYKGKQLTTFPIPIGNLLVDVLQLFVLPGWQCQSLYDTDDSIIPTAISLINNREFIENMKDRVIYGVDYSEAVTRSFSYTFPKGEREHKQDTPCIN